MRRIFSKSVLRSATDLALRLFFAGYYFVLAIGLIMDWRNSIAVAAKDTPFFQIEPELWLQFGVAAMLVVAPLLAAGFFTRLCSFIYLLLALAIGFGVSFSFAGLFHVFLMMWILAVGPEDWSWDRRRGVNRSNRRRYGLALAQTGLRFGLGLFFAIVATSAFSDYFMPSVPVPAGMAPEMWGGIFGILATVLFFGLGTRLAALLAVVPLAAIYCLTPLSPETAETLLWIIVLSGLLAIYGAGPLSLDAVRRRLRQTAEP